MGDGLSLQVNNTMKSGKIRNAAPDKAEARDLEAGKFGTAVPDLSALCARLEQRLNSANDAGLGKSSSAANDEKVEMETKEESTKATSGEADSKSPSQSATETIMKAVNSNLVIDFKLMAKINNFNLELDLVGMQKKMFQPDPDPEKPKYKISALDWSRVGETLHKHTTAIRDYEYIARLEDSQQTTSQYSRLWEAYGWDVFYWMKYGDINFKAYTERRTSPSDPLREWLKRGLPKSWAYSKEEMARRLDEYTHNAVAREVSPFVDKLARFVVAITGGLSLVLPMLVMRLNQNETKSLITTSVAVLIFSALVSIDFKATNTETLGITAAYAAVLVVFVGASA